MDRNRLIAALVLAATALFLLAQAPGIRWRRPVRIAAVAVYGAAVAAVAVYAILWMCGIIG